MGELSPDLFQSIRKTLKLCEDVFLNQRDLYNLFKDSRLEDWQDRLPEASTVGERVDRTIHYLNHQGGNALYLLLLVLSERYKPRDRPYLLLRQHMVALCPPASSSQEEKEEEAMELPLPFEDPFWSVRELENIQRCGRSVALVKVLRIHQGKAEYEETGTAWLIAPGLAVTCWHVVATIESPQQPPRTVQEVAQQIDHLLLYFGKAENNGQGISYRVQELLYPRQNVPTHDFAVLRIKDRRDHPYRQFAYLPIERDTAFTRQTRLSILQHPWGEEQQGSYGRFASHAENSEFIRYTAKTAEGASGGPVFCRDNWSVTAIHSKRIAKTDLGEGILIKTFLNTLQQEHPRLYQEIMEVHFLDKHPPARPVFSSDNHANPLERKPRAASFFATHKAAYQTPTRLSTNNLANYSHCFTVANDRVPLPLCLTFTQHHLAFSGQGGTVVLLGIPTLHEVAPIETLMPSVTSLASSSDGRFLAAGGSDGTVLLWDLKTSQRYRTLQLFPDWVGSLRFSPQGDAVVSSSENGQIKMFAVSDGVTRQQWTGLPGTNSPLFAFQPNLLASASALTHSGEKAFPPTWVVPAPQPTCLLFSPQGSYLACGTGSGALLIYDVAAQKPLHILELHKKAIRCLAFHPEETIMASAGDDQVIHLWHIVTGKHLQTIRREAARIQYLAFSPDGQLLASLDSDPKLILWTTEAQ
jgi:hypothetical protein